MPAAIYWVHMLRDACLLPIRDFESWLAHSVQHYTYLTCLTAMNGDASEVTARKQCKREPVCQPEAAC